MNALGIAGYKKCNGACVYPNLFDFYQLSLLLFFLLYPAIGPKTLLATCMCIPEIVEFFSLFPELANAARQCGTRASVSNQCCSATSAVA